MWVKYALKRKGHVKKGVLKTYRNSLSLNEVDSKQLNLVLIGMTTQNELFQSSHSYTWENLDISSQG